MGGVSVMKGKLFAGAILVSLIFLGFELDRRGAIDPGEVGLSTQQSDAASTTRDLRGTTPPRLRATKPLGVEELVAWPRVPDHLGVVDEMFVPQKMEESGVFLLPYRDVHRSILVADGLEGFLGDPEGRRHRDQSQHQLGE